VLIPDTLKSDLGIDGFLRRCTNISNITNLYEVFKEVLNAEKVTLASTDFFAVVSIFQTRIEA
jgi:hypothetical protein